MKISISLVVVFLVTSCAKTPVAESAAPSPAPLAEGPRAPLVVIWSEKELAAHSATLEARVEYRGRFTLPVHLAVKVPAGATLVSGPAELELPAQETATTVATEYKLSFASVPAGDLLLVADARGEASGVHAENVYRFGRPAPAPVVPNATGPSVKLGGHDLGPSIPLPPSK